MMGLRNMLSLRIIVGLLFVGVLSVGAADLSHAATILSVDNGDEPVAAVTDVLNWGDGFHFSEGMVSTGVTAFTLFESSYGQAHDLAGTFYGMVPTVAGFPSWRIDQDPNHLSFNLSQNLSSFGTAQMRPGTIVLQSSAPVKPISSLPSAVFIFGPVLIGILGVVLRQDTSLRRSAAAISSSSQVRPIPPMSPALILVLSPDATFAKQTEEQLHRSGHPIRVVPSVEEVFSIANHTPVSLVLVDQRASDWDMLRTDTTLRHVSIIALVPPGVAYTEGDCQADLERGADGVHYADEGPRLLLAKVGAYLRRAGVDVSRRGHYQVGSVELDTEVHEVKVGGQRIPLSAKPFVLLEAFMQAPSKAFSRTELVHLMWGPDFAIGEHTLDVHVHALRQLLDRDPNRLCRLMTIKGVGFKLKSFSLAMPASSVPNALPMAVNALPLIHTGVVHASNTQRSITSSTPSSRRTRLRQVPQQRHDRVLRRETSVRHLRSAVSVG
jgi:DNA-binding response OmpR family regulator